MCDLDDMTRGEYLCHKSALGEFWLSSDSIVATYSYWESMQHLISRIPAGDLESFETVSYTAGGVVLFPSNRIHQKWTINQARGMKKPVSDRMDSTLECIRRHYLDMLSPLADALSRYARLLRLVR